MKQLKYFIYVRISNTDYEKSLDEQSNICSAVAKKHNIDQKFIIPLNESRSGKNASSRPEFDKMIWILSKDAAKKPEQREYGWIIFYKIDRLARNYGDFEKLDRLFIWGYKFISCTETIENTPTGRLFFRILAGFAIYESEKLSTRMIVSYIHRLAQKNFWSLWWDSAIFWYIKKEYGKKDIRVERDVNAMSDLIIKIYDTFLGYFYVKWTTLWVYSHINQTLTKEEKNMLSKESKVLLTRKIQEIVENNHSMKYNGYIKYTVSIKDELVQNTLDYIKEQNDGSFDIEQNSNTIEDIDFIFYIPDFEIVPDILYSKVKTILLENKTQKVRKDKTTFNWLFEDMVYVVSKTNATTPYEWSKKNYNYRCKHLNITHEITEKNLKDHIDKILNKIPKLSPMQQELVHEVMVWEFKRDNEKTRQMQHWKSLSLEKQRIRYQKYIEDLEINSDLPRAQKDKIIQWYEYAIKDLNTEIQSIRELNQDFLEKINSLYDYKKILSTGDKYSQRDVYTLLLDHVIFESYKDKNWKKITTWTIKLRAWISEILEIKSEYIF